MRRRCFAAALRLDATQPAQQRRARPMPGSRLRRWRQGRRGDADVAFPPHDTALRFAVPVDFRSRHRFADVPRVARRGAGWLPGGAAAAAVRRRAGRGTCAGQQPPHAHAFVSARRRCVRRAGVARGRQSRRRRHCGCAGDHGRGGLQRRRRRGRDSRGAPRDAKPCSRMLQHALVRRISGLGAAVARRPPCCQKLRQRAEPVVRPLSDCLSLRR